MLSVLHFKDSPEGVNATPEWQDKVMYATLSIGPSGFGMVSDGFGMPWMVTSWMNWT